MARTRACRWHANGCTPANPPALPPLPACRSQLVPGKLDRMEAALRRHYDDADANRAITTVPLYSAGAAAPGSRYHLVFCLDASGSMGGSPWSQVVSAYQQTLQRRMSDQAFADLVTAISFNHTAYTCCSAVDIQRASTPLYTSGGTSFAPALQAAHAAMAAAPADATPVLIFMSDGENTDAAASVAAMQALWAAYGRRGLRVHTVAFGSGVAMLQSLAGAVPGGQYHACRTGVDLAATFVSIAAGCNAVDNLVKRFAEILSDAVSLKVVVDYL